MKISETTEVLWDSWGVPHIYAKDTNDLFQAFGWAQMHSHGNLILRLYGQARGKASEYWGEEYLESDKYVRRMGVYRRAEEWYEQQSPAFISYLNAFATGINFYAQENPNKIDNKVKVVLPVNGVDVLAHIQRVIHFHFVINQQDIDSLSHCHTSAGSNAWAISSKYSASGNAMLLANPHLPWSDLFLWYEAQLTGPNIDAYGTALVGWPVLGIAFNDYLGWTFTINTFNGAIFYELSLTDDGYSWDGNSLPFERESQILKVKQEDGSLREEQLIITRSIHGPVVVQEENKAFALRVVGLDQPHLIEQLWDMARAKSLSQFEASLKRLQLPLFNVLYADTEGQILYLFNAQVPVRKAENWDYWQHPVPSDTSDNLWTEYHPYEDLPRVLNPSTGWLQNTNDPPWTTTFPTVLNPDHYPPYLAPSSLGETKNIFRPQRSIKMLTENEKITFDEMIAYKFSSRIELAERLLDILITAARQLGSELVQDCADVLEAWDRQANANSRGTLLFTLWLEKMKPFDFFSNSWNEISPMSTPYGLANPDHAIDVLESVATEIQSIYGTLDIPWGEIARIRYGDKDLPACGISGDIGSFRVLNLVAVGERDFQVVAGDSYIAAIEFSNPIRAKVLTTYGNATQPGSPHIGDQLPLYIRGELRPVWRTRKEIEANLESLKVF
jgi:acyl-homoserine-lactone acylase